MTAELSRGANAPVPSASVTVCVQCASAVDVSALLLGENGKVRSDADLIFYNQPDGPGVSYLPAAVGPRGLTAVQIDTAALPAEVEKVAVTASLDGSGAATFGSAGGLVATILDASGGEAFVAPATGLSTEAALVVAEIYRRAGVWKVRSVMQGYDSGLAGIATEFGVDVEGEATPTPTPAPPPNTAPVEPPPFSRPGAPPTPPTGAPYGAPPAFVNLDKGRVSLTKHQTVSLVKTGAPALTHVVMGLGWDPARAGRNIDLDASVIAFDDRRREVDKVWFMAKQGCRGAIRHSGDNLTGQGQGDDEQIRVDLGSIPANVVALVFTVNSFSGQKFTDVRNAYCRLLDPSNRELVHFPLTESAPATGVLMCAMRRTGATWTMTAIGEFHRGKTVRSMVGPAADWLARGI